VPEPDPEIVARLRAAGCVFAEDEARLLTEAAGSPGELESLLRRRVAGEPLEPLLGWVEFCGLRILIDPGVFVPRRRTELLARRAAGLAAASVAASGSATVVDLCCGAGAIGAVVRDAVPSAEVFAADLDADAVRCARRNLPADRVFRGDLFDPLPPGLRGRVDVLAVNAPYVPTGAIALMPPEAREHEPGVALDGGADGLDVHRRIAAEAAGWLAPGGTLLIEAGEEQAAVSAALFAASGLTTRVESDDDLGATVVLARRPD
jgi:release factor glutamine methyltransferase